MRADLLALTPEAIAALANLGLVKRAQRELEQGKGPAIEEDAGSVVTAVFEDGVTVKLPPGVALREAQCSCGASGACRHRVASVLAYQKWAMAAPRAASLSEDVPTTEGPSPVAPVRWSPGDLTDEVLIERLGKKMIEIARQLARRGATVEVQRNAEGQPPVAMLPACTVRFLVPNDLAYAKCDCARRTDCEHVALSVWAFRKADTVDRDAARLVVDVHVSDDAEVELGPFEGALSVMRAVLLDGVSGYHGALAQKFAMAREDLEKAGYTWPHVALEDLEETLEAYRTRSSRYRAGTIVELGAELVARQRGSGGGALPSRHVLGTGEALETKLDQLKLIGLGGHVDGSGRSREVEVFFADPDSGAVLVFRKEWNFKPEEILPEGAAIGGKRAMTGVSIGSLAKGLVVTRVAKRRANRSLVFGESRGGMTSVTPQKGEWGSLPEPLLLRSLSHLEELFKSRPPKVLRPRVLAEDVHVLPVRDAQGAYFSPGAQQLEAVLTDLEGEQCLLAKPFRSVVPLSTDHLAAALGGAHGAVRFVAGAFRRAHLGLVLEPLAVVADRLVVPDFETGDAASAVTGGVAGPSGRSPVEGAIQQGWALLEEVVQLGMRQLPASFVERLSESAAWLEETGLRECGRLVGDLAMSVGRLRTGDGSEGEERAAGAFLEAALRLTLARERL